MSVHDPVIERGMALLDASAPGWEWRVDLDDLDLSSCTLCVVGQLYAGDYSGGLRALGEEDGSWIVPREVGFALSDGHHAMTYGGLTTAWRRAIRARRRARVEA